MMIFKVENDFSKMKIDYSIKPIIAMKPQFDNKPIYEKKKIEVVVIQGQEKDETGFT